MLDHLNDKRDPLLVALVTNVPGFVGNGVREREGPAGTGTAPQAAAPRLGLTRRVYARLQIEHGERGGACPR